LPEDSETLAKLMLFRQVPSKDIAHLCHIARPVAFQAGEYVFLFAGQEKSLPASGNLRFLPCDCGFFHPDLIGASDLVVGKVGYSTLAEVYAAGVPWAYISRKSFPESRVLVDFIRQNHMGAEVSADDVHNGSWLDQLPELINMQREIGPRENGADGAADFIIDRVL